MNIILNEVKNNCLTIDIVGNIGQSMFSEGFTSNMLQEQLSSQEFNEIVLNISSLGGDAHEGLQIYNMLEFQKQSGKRITCNLIGAVASAAVTIAMAGDNRTMLENSLMLVHFVSASFKGKIEDMKEQVKLIEPLNNNLISIYCLKTGMDKQEMTDLLNAEKWLNSKEALKMGFITNIIKTPKTKNKIVDMEAIINQINESELPKVESIEEIEEKVTTETIENITEEVKVEEVIQEENKVVEPIITNEVTDNVTDMINVENYIKDIENLKLEITSKDDQISSLTNKVDILTLEVESFKKSVRESEINGILNEAVKTNKISNSLKDNYRKLLNSNFEDTKELISKLNPNKSVSITSLISEEKENSNFNWTIRDWEKQNPQGLLEMKSNNPERYNDLFNSYYRKSK